MNIISFMQLLCNRYFGVLADHKAIKYMIKSKTESPMTRLKTLLLKLSEYTIELKYQKGSEMYTSDALSRLHNFTDTPDQKDVIPLNFLQHFTPNYIEHSYSHLVGNLYAHKTKTLDATTVKRKRGRLPEPKQCNDFNTLSTCTFLDCDKYRTDYNGQIDTTRCKRAVGIQYKHESKEDITGFISKPVARPEYGMIYQHKGTLLQNLHCRYLYILIKLPNLLDLEQ